MYWDQLRTLVWLRWRLTRNQWSRGGQLNAVITTIAAGAGLCLAVAGGIGGVIAGATALSHVEPSTLRWAWDSVVVLFLFLWSIGLIAEIQRSEIIDLTRLMHLPISLRGAFVLNYLASHLTFGLALTVPLAIGLCAGLVLGRGVSMGLLMIAVFGFFFMITAWTYYLRGWLASLMVNQRRRRAVVMGVTLAFVLMFQLPNLFFNVWMRGEPGTNPRDGLAQQRAAQLQGRKSRILDAIDLAHRAIPVLWLPQSASWVAQDRLALPLVVSFGSIALGAFGLQRAYRSTLRFYLGSSESRAAGTRRTSPAAPGTPRKNMLEGNLRMLPEEAAAMTLANLRSMLRAPEVKMTLVVNVAVFAIIAVGSVMRSHREIPELIRAFMATGAVLLTYAGLMQLQFNQFGFDRDGFRALVLLPTPRRLILLGKNISILPLATVVFLILLSLLVILASPPPSAIVGACLQFVAGFCYLSAVGNFLSIVAPYRMTAGSLKPTKTKATTSLLIAMIAIMFPIAMAPMLIPASFGLICERFGWFPGLPVDLLASALLAAVAILGYWLSLDPLGRFLQRREQRILDVVTRDVE